jgi:glycosyltransferase involved in cell wall biosynthesis
VKIVSVMTTSSLGGAEYAAVEMLIALQDRGHETVMLTDQPEMVRAPVRGAPIAIGPKLARPTFVALGVRSPLLLRRLRLALEREAPYDVLLLHYKKEQLLARRLPARLRATLAWAEWGPVPFPLRKGLPGRMYARAAHDAAVIMAISAGTKRSVCAMGVPEEKVAVVPNAMHVDDVDFTAEGRRRVRERLGIPTDAFVVGCLSRFHPKKRNDVLVDAVIALGRDDVHLIMGGAGETEAQLQARAAPLGGRAHFIRTPREEVSDILSSFDVLVFCPSPTEGAPRAVILGMLARRPTLSSGPEGVDDMIEPEFGAIASPENDPEALAELLRPYAENRALAQRAGEVARRRAVELYSAPRVAELIEGLLVSAGAPADARAGTGTSAGLAARR